MTTTKPARMLGLLLSISGVVVAVFSATLGATAAFAGVALVVLALVAVYAIRHPATLLAVLVAVEVTNFSGVTQLPLISPLVGLGLLTVGISLRDRAMRKKLDRWTALGVLLAGGYLFTQALAMLSSQSLGDSMTRLTESVLDCMFLVVVFLLVRITSRPWLVAQAFVVSLAALSLLSLANQVVFDGAQPFGGFANVTQATAELITTPRYAGPLADSNFWGRQLILGLPLAGALIVRAAQSRRSVAVAGWAAAAGALLGGIYLTQSRGTMLTTAVVIVVWVVASGSAARRMGLWGLPLVAVIVFAVPGIGNRLTDLASDVFTSGYKYGVDLSVIERTAAQEMAWAMFLDRPFFGVGPNAFLTMVPTYADRVATSVLRPTDAPHNLYAQLAGESGIFGLLGWIVFVGTFIVLLALRVPQLAKTSAPSDRSLAAAVLAALIGWSFASIFLHLSYFRTFAIILALAWALVSSSDTLKLAAVSFRRLRPDRVRQVAVSATVAIASALVFLIATGTPTYVATARVTLLPTEQLVGHYAYALDVRSRGIVVPTYAAAIAAHAPDVTAVPHKVRGVITISTEDTDIQAARERLYRAWSNAYMNLDSLHLDHYFTIGQVGPIHYDSHISHSPTSVIAAVLTAAAAGLGAMLVMLRSSSRKSRRDEPVALFATRPARDDGSVRHLERRQDDDLLKRP